MRIILASSLFIVFYSMISKYVQDIFNIPDPISTTLFGILIAGQGLGFVHPHYVASKHIISISSRIILCIQTMAVALSLPKNYLFKNFKSIFSLVLIIGIIKCIFTFMILRIFSYLDSSTCWAIAAPLTPTDPILSSCIIKGKFSKAFVPEKIRLLLSAESGINDGFGILMLGISFDILKDTNFRLGILKFLVKTILNKAIFSAVIGYCIGYLIQKITKKFCTMEMIRSEILSVHTFSLCFLGLALMDALGGSELICIFFLGIALNSDEWYTLESSSNKLAEIIENIFCKVFFIHIGTMIDFSRFTMRMVFICALILLIRRPLILLLGYRLIPAIENKKEALFVGWFGPVGVGALYYCLMYDRKMDTLTVDYGMCTILMSTIIHGLSVPFYNILQKIARKSEPIRGIYEI